MVIIYLLNFTFSALIDQWAIPNTHPSRKPAYSGIAGVSENCGVE
jgi:hypothetical protein